MAHNLNCTHTILLPCDLSTGPRDEGTRGIFDRIRIFCSSDAGGDSMVMVQGGSPTLTKAFGCHISFLLAQGLTEPAGGSVGGHDWLVGAGL